MLNFWDYAWDLRVEECPCDVHFCDWLEARAVTGAAIFHFGTGSHHYVGVRTAGDGSGNAVLGINASPGEYETYIKLSIEKPEAVRSYKAFFGDIYQLDARLLPEFDVVTLFHLCEFRSEKNDAYGALTDLQVAQMLVDKLRPGGFVLFYKGSFAFEPAKAVIADLERTRPVAKVEDYETLLVYRKAG